MLSRRIVSILLAVAIISSSLAATATMAAQFYQTSNGSWPWGNAPEPFPWLNWLASLPHKTGISLTIITRHEATVINEATKAFLNSPVAQKLGIKNLIAIYAGPELWKTYIEEAYKAKRPIDIAWGGGPTLFNYIDQWGYIQPLDVKKYPEFYAVLYEMSKIPKEIAGAPTYKVGKDGLVHWIGAAISSFGITINKDKLKQWNVPAPIYWINMTNPIYAKYLPDIQMLGIADPTKSTSNTRMYEIVLQAYGWNKGWQVLTLMAANSKIYDSSSAVRDGVIRGEIAAGITIDFYGYTAMHQNPACEYIIPPGQSIVNADPIAILKGTRYPVAAAAFTAWVLSQYGGQQVWLLPDINRLPINPLTFQTPMGKKRPDLYEAWKKATSSKVINFNETLADATERAMQFYFKATLVNAHDVLQSVWAAIAKAYLDHKINKEQFDKLVGLLTAPFPFKDPTTGKMVTFTVKYAIYINPKLSSGSIYQALMNEWEQGARMRYQFAYKALQDVLAGKPIPTPPWQTGTQTTTTTQTQTTTHTTTTTAPQTTTTTTQSPTTTSPVQTTTTAPQTPTTTTTSGGISAGEIAAIVIAIIIIAAIVAYYAKRR